MGNLEKECFIYENILKSMIPRLHEFSFLQGSEGKVYFIDDKFVIKEFHDAGKDAKLFDSYCKEIKKFSNMGYAVPKIYSWTALSEDESDYYYFFILEERVAGSILFDREISSIYNRCKYFCSQNEFLDAVTNCGSDYDLLGAIAREFLNQFIETNQNLVNMSDIDLEKFIKSDYLMTKNRKFSYPDIQACNVMFDGSKLTIIDNAFLQTDIPKENDKQLKSMLIKDMIILFFENDIVQFYSSVSRSCSEELKRLKKVHSEVCFEAMRRFVRKTNEIYKPKIYDKYDYIVCEKIIRSALNSPKFTCEICAEIQREF